MRFWFNLAGSIAAVGGSSLQPWIGCAVTNSSGSRLYQCLEIPSVAVVVVIKLVCHLEFFPAVFWLSTQVWPTTPLESISIAKMKKTNRMRYFARIF